MSPLRKEIDQYSRSCERLISAAVLPGEKAFTVEEIQLIAYYVKELTSLVDRLLPSPHSQEKQGRQTMRDYAQTSEALLAMKNLSDEERDSIRDSVADVTEQFLDADQGQ